MAKYAGVQFTLFLVDGYNLIASISESVTMGKESITQQTNSFGAGNETHTPLNVEKSELTVGNGFWDSGSDPLHSVTGGSQGIRRIVCAAIEGNTIGKHFMGFEGAYDTKVELLDQRDGLTKANVAYQINGDCNEGVIVLALATFTAAITTSNDVSTDFTTDPVQSAQPITSNSVDAGATSTITCPTPHNLTSNDIVLISEVITSNPTINGSRTVTVLSPTTFSVPVDVTTGGTGGSFVKVDSNAGGVGYLQVTAFSGFSSVTPTISHSIDNTTYNTLVTFAAVTAIGRQRVAVTGNVRRYLSTLMAVSGSGSVTLFTGFCRN